VVAAVAQTLRGQVVDVNLVGISLDPADTAAAIASQRSPALDRRERSLGRRPRPIPSWLGTQGWFVEYGMGLRSVILGHSYPPAVKAVVCAASEA
jgi:hypothetical protein